MILDDYIELVGMPTGGAVRVSLGIASNFADVERFMAFAMSSVSSVRSRTISTAVVRSRPSPAFSSFAPVEDVRRTLTPQLRTDLGETLLIVIDLGRGKNRLGASCFAQVMQQIGNQAPTSNTSGESAAGARCRLPIHSAIGKPRRIG